MGNGDRGNDWAVHVGCVDDDEVGAVPRRVVHEPDEPSAVGVVALRWIGDEHEITGLARSKDVALAVRRHEIVLRYGPVAGGPEESR